MRGVSRVAVHGLQQCCFYRLQPQRVHFSGGCMSQLGRAGTPTPGASSGVYCGVALAGAAVSLERHPQFGGDGSVGELARRRAWGKLAAMRAKVLVISPPHNMSANTDAQVRSAAPRPVLGRRLPSR
jgi:hypothetical protein